MASRSSRTTPANTASWTRTFFHAHRNPIRISELDEGFTMVIGASRTAVVFEVGVVHASSAPVIVHAMLAREKFLR